jgi:hypothetical protein
MEVTSESSVTLHEPVPWHSGELQPVKLAPPTGLAVNLTAVPCG